MTKIIDLVCTEAKGDKIKRLFSVGDDVASAIVKRLETSYVTKEVVHLHKPFLIFSDLDDTTHIIAIEDIRKMQISNKPAGSQ